MSRDDNEREFWIAEGDDKAKAEAFISARAAAHVTMAELAKRYGDGEFVTRGGAIAGLAMADDKAPEGWREVTRMQLGDRFRPLFYPKRSTKALKAIDAELRSVHAEGASRFTQHMGGRSTMKSGDGHGMRILYMSWEYIGDTLLLSVPASDNPEKPCFTSTSSRKLAMSEYWALREAQEEKERQAALAALKEIARDYAREQGVAPFKNSDGE